MEDYLVIGMDKKEHFRAYAARTTGLAEEARRRHNTSPTASAALGRVLTAGVLNGKLDVGGGVGKTGQLSITKNMGLRDPYTGNIPLVSGEIGEDIATYYARSEQIPSVVALGVLVDTDTTVRAAGGYLIQAFPGAEEQELAGLEERACGIPNMSRLIDEGVAPEEVLQRLLGQDFVELQRKPVSFKCGCSRERLEKILVSLGEKEIRELIDQQEKAEVRCHFCGDRYYFEAGELSRLLLEARG